MPLLRLSGIGKIYYSEGNVAVGIRGIDLSFERGEFVAITGASGSGKSTLLNVISSMDSYEEGELYIEDAPTSHYLESDWEEYRSKYISFIFQDYNILESYTVLQNVELALMHIKDRRERRKRALELLTRVGMEKHLRQKGSKLSGGQKQRTVIARALAKDSPIILADEPTGNLDETTSKEIIELLREVSKDKLLIIVTHNYEEVEAYATRHIRIFDGSVEFDRGEKPAGEAVREVKEFNYSPPKKKKFNLRAFLSDLKNGSTLGGHVFASRPKLAIFTCMLMAIGMLGIFLTTSICFSRDIVEMNQYNMFEHIDGRVVVVRRDGTVPTQEEIDALAEKYGAESAVRCDYLYDRKFTASSSYYTEYFYYYEYEPLQLFLRDVSELDGQYDGSLPEKAGEILLRLPISRKTEYEDVVFGETAIYFDSIRYVITGIGYYYDNNINPTAYVTASEFENICAIKYFRDKSTQIDITATVNGKLNQFSLSINEYGLSRDLGDKIHFRKEILNPGKLESATVSVRGGDPIELGKDRFATALPEELNDYSAKYSQFIGADLYAELAKQYTEDNYKQFSLMFGNESEAKRAASKLTDEGYIAVMSDATYKPDAFESFAYGFLLIMMLAIWLGAVLCLAFFIRLCQARSIVSFKNDIAIMRSMGIKTNVIKISMYMRSVIAIIPAIIALVAVAIYIFTSPTLNSLFTYLYGWQYALICIGLLIIALNVSRKQQSKLFADSVKKTLTGGALND